MFKPITTKTAKVKTKIRVGDKARDPHPGVPLKKEKILELILKYNGILARVADALGTTRGTVRRRCKEDPELAQALEDARERLIDDVEESVFQRAAESNDTALQCFVLKTQGRHRGWEQDMSNNATRDVAQAAFDFIINKSKNPAESSPNTLQ